MKKHRAVYRAPSRADAESKTDEEPTKGGNA